MPLRIMASRHSAFYSPLLCCICFLQEGGHEIDYSLLGPGQRSHALLRDGQVDIMQSAVSSNWNAIEHGVQPLPVHFAQINTRDGFFLVGRQTEADFNWKDLEGRTLLADHGLQPLVMLKYAVRHNGADWNKITVVDAGSPEQMEAAFTAGRGDYIHLQAPIAVGEIVASVGASMPPVAFSSLCCARAFQGTQAYNSFLRSYGKAREWLRTASPEEVAETEASFFPSVPLERLVSAVARYQAIGCWEGGLEIPRDLYEQALNVFHAAGTVARRHSYDNVVG